MRAAQLGQNEQEISAHLYEIYENRCEPYEDDRIHKKIAGLAESAVKNLVGLVEPLSTVFIALIVGFIAMAVVMPMYSALGSLGN